MTKTIALAHFAIVIVLATAAMYGFYRLGLGMVSSGPAALGFATPEDVRLEAPLTSAGAAFTEPVNVEYDRKKESSPRALVTFTAFRLLAGDGKLAGDFSLKVPGPLKEKFEPQLTEIVGCPEGRTGAKTQPKLDKDYADRNLIISTQNAIGSSSVNIPISLEDFLASSIDSDSESCQEKRKDVINRPTEFRVPTELPVMAGPVERYPSDYHQLSGNFQIRLPKGFTLSGATQEDVSGLGSLPAALPCAMRIRSSQGMEGRTILLLRSQASRLPLPTSVDEPRITAANVNTMPSPSNTQFGVTPQQDDVDLRLLIVRNSRVQYFTYAVAFVPLLLMQLIATSLFTGGRSTTEETWNLAGFTLAVLGLRAVLVPSDVQGLTQIDYILVIQLLAMFAMIPLLNGLQIMKSAPRNAAREQGD